MIGDALAQHSRAVHPHGEQDGDFAGRVRHLYQEAGLSTRRIAATLGVSRGVVERALRGAGVPMASRGVGRPRPPRLPEPAGMADRLRQLYVEQRLTRRQISDVLGIPESLVRARLARYGIDVRTRGAHNRQDRRGVGVDRAVRLYLDVGLTADQAAAELGVSRWVLLRTAHDHRLPVRPVAAQRRGDAPVRLLAALYSDRLVRDALERHGIPVNVSAGPIWQRFPSPAPLTVTACIDLYVHAGLSTTQIELVTGHPAGTVRRRLRHAGVALRSAGGRSPFRRRAEAAHAVEGRELSPDPHSSRPG